MDFYESGCMSNTNALTITVYDKSKKKNGHATCEYTMFCSFY